MNEINESSAKKIHRACRHCGGPRDAWDGPTYCTPCDEALVCVEGRDDGADE